MSVAAERLTASQFFDLPEVQAGAWLELVQGEVIVSPRPNYFHSYAATALTEILGSYIRSQHMGVLYSELDTVFDADDVRVPDLLFYRTDRAPNPTIHPNDTIPDLCTEILSPGNARTDRVDKFQLYQAKGVAHYWIVDPDQCTIEAYALEAGRYVSSGRGADKQFVKLPPFPALEISLSVLWHPTKS